MKEINSAVATAVKSGGSEKYLTYFSDSQLFGIPIWDVIQIVGIQEITTVPNMPHYAKGLINLRGEIIPLIDMRLRLGKEEAEYTDRTCIIIVSIKEHSFGFIVDEVDEVTDISDELISAPPKLSRDETGNYLSGLARLNNKIVLLLDAARLLGDDDINLLTQAG